MIQDQSIASNETFSRRVLASFSTLLLWEPVFGVFLTLSFAVLATALLFGGLTLYSFGFAAFLFNALTSPAAGASLRNAFPATVKALLAHRELQAFADWVKSMPSEFFVPTPRCARARKGRR